MQESFPQKKSVLFQYQVQNTNEIYKQGAEDLDSRSNSQIYDKTRRQVFQFDNYKTTADYIRSVFIEPLTPKQCYQSSKNKTASKSILQQSSYNNVDKQCQNILNQEEYLFEDQSNRNFTFERNTYQKNKNQILPQNSKKQFFSKKSNIFSIQNQKKILQYSQKPEQRQLAQDQNLNFNEDNKKYKKGLASISLKVKNIVLQKGELTFKQVSDLVLQSSLDELNKLNQSDKQKQIKNIKRRVYDALNVLVSVQILGKHKDKKHVIKTQWTNFQGKKLTSQWQKIRQQQQQIAKRKKFQEQKEANLRNAKFKYEQLMALRKRNKQIQQNKHIIKNLKQYSESEYYKTKIYFPFIVIPKIHNLQVEYYKQESENSLIVRGKNISIISDIDAVSKMRFDEAFSKNLNDY